MNILALDTSSPACSVALLNDNKLTERHNVTGNQHSSFLLALVDELLGDAQLGMENLDAVAVGNGPGSFTGIRLGMGVAQGLAFGINKPLIAVSSLHAIAQASASENVLVAVDARMSEVYWQCFRLTEDRALTPLQPARLDRPGELVLKNADLNWQGIGSGFDQYCDQLSVYLREPDNWIRGAYPRASSIIQLALDKINKTGMPGDDAALPVYMRNKVTH